MEVVNVSDQQQLCSNCYLKTSETRIDTFKVKHPMIFSFLFFFYVSGAEVVRMGRSVST